MSEPRPQWLSENVNAELASAKLAVKTAAMQRQLDKELRRAKVRKQREVEEREAAFQEMYEQVLEQLDYGSGITGKINHILDHDEKLTKKKKRELYEEWQQEVFENIQGQIDKALSKRPAKDVEARLQEQYSKFLHASNTKLGLFRDVVIESDYNPFEALKGGIKAHVGNIKDPVKRDLLKTLREQSMVRNDGVEPTSIRARTKPTLDNQMWDDLHIHATPYGHCMDVTGNYIIKPVDDKLQAVGKSRVLFDHYTYPRGNDAALAEVPPGKMILPPPMSKQRKGLQDLLRHAAQMEPGATYGDLWLEYRGRLVPPGPEQRRGRADLTAIIQQLVNPHLDSQSSGDIWLEARGKQRVPGPEQRRGRRDLFETFQMKSNPYTDGRTLGDAWLEYKGRRTNCPPGQSLLEVIRTDDMAQREGTPPSYKFQKRQLVDPGSVRESKDLFDVWESTGKRTFERKGDAKLLTFQEEAQPAGTLPHIPYVGPMQKSSLQMEGTLTSTFDNSNLTFTKHFDAY